MPTPTSRPSDRPALAILVVDDEPLVRDMTCTMLRRMGHRTVQAPDGRVGLELFRARPDEIDLVVLDESMPGLPGHEVAATLRAEGHETPILVITGYSAEAVGKDVVQLPRLAVLAKPFRFDALREAIDGLMG